MVRASSKTSLSLSSTIATPSSKKKRSKERGLADCVLIASWLCGKKTASMRPPVLIMFDSRRLTNAITSRSSSVSPISSASPCVYIYIVSARTRPPAAAPSRRCVGSLAAGAQAHASSSPREEGTCCVHWTFLLGKQGHFPIHSLHLWLHR